MWKPIILLIGLSCLLILIVAGYEVKTISEENHIALLDRDSNEMLEDINYNGFSRVDEITKALSQNQLLKQMCFKKNIINYNKAVTVLNTVKETTNIEVCYVMDLRGLVIAASEYTLDKNVKIEGQNYKFRPYFMDALNGKSVIYPAIGVTTKVRGIYFSSPVRGDDNKIIGVVTCKIGMEVIDKILKGYTEKSLITTSDGVVFSTNEKAWFYKTAYSISNEKLNSIMKSKQFSDIIIRPLNFLVNNKGIMLDSKKYYVSQKSIGKTGWKLIVLSDFEGMQLFMPMQLKFIAIIFVILIALMFVIIILINDVFKRRVSELNLKKFFQAMEQTSSTIVITDKNGSIDYVNPEFTKLTGYTIEEVINKKTNILKSGEHDDEFYKKMWTTILSGENWHGNICNRRKDGKLYWEDANISSVKNARGEITSFIAVKEDITERRELDVILNMYATMDEMTGTFNRRSCMMLLEKQLQISKRHNQNFVIFFIDINGLKSVNDTLGHSSGDELITSAVNCVKVCLRQSDSLCRLGGDEFLVILPDTNLPRAEIILERIGNEIQNINNEERYPFIISLSFGAADYLPLSQLTIDDLIHIADERMYKNKAEIKQTLGVNGILR